MASVVHRGERCKRPVSEGHLASCHNASGCTSSSRAESVMLHTSATCKISYQECVSDPSKGICHSVAAPLLVQLASALQLQGFRPLPSFSGLS